MPTDDAKVKQKLRRIARAQGMPDLVCIEKRQLARLKTLAIAYLEKVVEEAKGTTGDKATDASIKMIQADALKEIKQIKRCV
jgi:hypothetical protein